MIPPAKKARCENKLEGNMDMASALAEMRHERDRFVAFAFASADILLELDEDGHILFADGAVKGLLGFESQDVEGREFYTLLPRRDAQRARDVMKEMKQKLRMERTDIHLRTAKQEALPFRMSGFRLSTLRNHTYISLSMLKPSQLTTDQLFHQDVETGLLKTKHFVEAANKRIIEAKTHDETLQVTLLDIPELKALLDQLIDADADKLLYQISDYIRSRSVGGDTAGAIEGGGYSFVHDDSVEPAEIIKGIIELTKQADPEGKGVTVRSNTINADPCSMSRQDSANALLYTLNTFAQSQGEDFSIDSLSTGYARLLDDTVNRMAQFKQTVAGEDFKIAFQPIVDLKTGLIHHYEALVRINDQEVFKNPFDFITFGEQAGIIGDFDLLMCQKVMEVLERTAKNGNYPLVAVNLSGKSLGSMLFKDALRKLVSLNEKVRKQVIFEVTESSKIEDMQSANTYLQELRKGGNLCCLDDFGTGESSFDYLRNLQVDFIKIDGSYVREAIKTQRGRHMLKAMASLCRELDITTIGEMVEDEKEAALLWEAGVKFGQGYLFGKPDIDENTIVNCKKPTPFYNGIMRAKRFDKRPRAWWAAENSSSS